MNEPLTADGHTPGPWISKPDQDEAYTRVHGQFEDEAGEYFVAKVCDANGEAQNKANLALILAAPDLLRALLELLPGLELDLRYADPDDDLDALRSRVKTIRDALEKALG